MEVAKTTFNYCHIVKCSVFDMATVTPSGVVE